MTNKRVSPEAVTQIINWFKGSDDAHPATITSDIVADMLDGKECTTLCEYTCDTDVNEILEYLSDDTDTDDLANGAIIQFIHYSRYELGLDDMLFIGEIAQEISSDMDLIWSICSQDLPRNERMRIRIARFFNVKPESEEEK